MATRETFLLMPLRFFHLSFKEPVLDLLNSHGGKQPLKGDCRNNEEVDNCFCRIEIDDRQLKALLLRLLFSLSNGWQLGSCCTAEILRASGSMQLQIEPYTNKNEIKFSNLLQNRRNFSMTFAKFQKQSSQISNTLFLCNVYLFYT